MSLLAAANGSETPSVKATRRPPAPRSTCASALAIWINISTARAPAQPRSPPCWEEEDGSPQAHIGDWVHERTWAGPPLELWWITVKPSGLRAQRVWLVGLLHGVGVLLAWTLDWIRAAADRAEGAKTTGRPAGGWRFRGVKTPDQRLLPVPRSGPGSIQSVFQKPPAAAAAASRAAAHQIFT